jgi:type I restriction enzyme, S subunit
VRTRVYFDGLSQMVLRAPGVVEQERIGAVLKQLEDDASLTAATLIRLRHQKRGLMQKLLTGELRLDERFEPAVGASILTDRITAQ